MNSSPTQTPSRYAIDFEDLPETKAREQVWSSLLQIVETKVKPDPARKSKDFAGYPFWLYWRPRMELRRSIDGKARVLVTSQTSSMRIFAFVNPHSVFSHKVVVFPVEPNAFFAVMQSRVHIEWAAFFGSTMKDDPVYTPSDCFETFPFPPDWESSPALDDIGRRYDAHRAALMRATIGTKKPQGLTATYNRFHSANERSAEIATLRALHAEMDRAVLDAYGWKDLRPTYDYREQLDERVRYTWDDDTRDEVLARLLQENRQRAASGGAASRRRDDEDGEEGTDEDAEDAETPTEAVETKAPKGKSRRPVPPSLPGVE